MASGYKRLRVQEIRFGVLSPRLTQDGLQDNRE
jgi:hypothetical protein